jgi:multiple sugar transport system permease protein
MSRGSSLRFWRRVAMALIAYAFLAPLVYLLSVSLHAEGRGLGGSVLQAASDPHWENYPSALARMGDWGRLFANTLLVTVLCVAGQLFTCSLAGYAFARIDFRGRDALFGLVLATMMLPEQATSIPRFLLFRGLGLVDTYGPLTLPAVLGGSPFFVFLFRQYFLALGAELGDAARIDGCSHWRAWWSIFLPLARPMLVTVGIFTFLGAWNDLWTPLVYLMSPEKGTLTLALASFNRSYNTAVELMMAASAVVLAPCLLVYFLLQRLFLRGIEVAASKH